MAKKKFVVRIENIELHNFKNIEDGSVFFSEYKKLERKDISDDNFSNVLGIYGQNASGKTSIIDALKIVRQFISGGGMTSGIQNYIKKGEDNFSVVISFLLTGCTHTVLLDYKLELKKNQNSIFIDNESLHSYESSEDKYKLGDRQCLFSYSSKNGLKDNFLSKFTAKDKKTILSYLVSQKTNIPFNSSSIAVLFSSLFNDETIKIISEENNFHETSEILSALIDFCKNKFLIVTTNLFDDINERGVGVNGFDFDENQDRIHKNFAILFGKQTLEEDKYNDFLKMLDASGKVLNTLVPGLTIAPKVFDQTINANGKKSIVFEVMSIHDDKEIPLFFESRGVKQMLTYVGDLIGVFNEEGTFIAIDELDSGVFEYLLGELVYSFDNFSLGQLLFTSHNFRILEKIKSNEIFFTTTNDKNKFVQPKYIKNNNNLRDVYYRLIVQGGDEDSFYNKTSSTDISKTLSSLGKATK
ncbi:MAG: AAA family ATPase [Bacilli bacterium]|nr:AAA family ATPase [Bacilli bacterium]